MIDQELGYDGQDRFVLFYFEPRGREVRWRDSQGSGSVGVGFTPAFAQIEARARAVGITLGDSLSSGDHVLLVDRLEHQACFAYREQAQEFLARRGTVSCDF